MPPAAAPFIGAGIGALGLIQQSNANRRAQSQADSQLALQRDLIAQQQQGLNDYRSALGEAHQGGAFNPDYGVAQANHDRAYSEAQALGNEAAAARVLGYHPGDTAPLDAMNSTRGAYNLQAAQENSAIRNQAYANLLAAVAPLLPNATGASIGALGDNYRALQAQQIPLGGMLGALSPYLQQIATNSGSHAAANPLGFVGPYNPANSAHNGSTVNIPFQKMKSPALPAPVQSAPAAAPAPMPMPAQTSSTPQRKYRLDAPVFNG